MFLYGFHPVREVLRHRPGEARRVLVVQGRRSPRRREIEDLCRRHRVPLVEAAATELDALAGRGHNGLAVELVPQPATALRAGFGDPDLVVLVEDVQDPRNLGALLRVCEGAGVGRVLIRDRGSAPLSPAVAKTSAGAIEWLPVERITNTAQAIEEGKGQGFWVYGAAAGGSPPWELDLTGRVLLCFGGEEKGLRHRTRQVVDGLIGLPMRGRVGSLNLATAAAAILYEVVRQRMVAGAGGRG